MAEKEAHLKACADFLRWADSIQEEIYSPDIRSHLLHLMHDLRDLRDTEYYFESGERDLDRLYKRYLPYLKTILQEYITMQESNNYEQIQHLTVRLRAMLVNLDEAVRAINALLPQDEIDEAEAKARAEELKRKLDEMSGYKKR